MEILEKESRDRLRNLGKYITNIDSYLDAFGVFLADYLQDLSFCKPLEFALGCELALADLKRGKNGYTGAPISNWLSSVPLMAYSMLSHRIPDIADAIFSEEFAANVKAIIKEVEKAEAASQATK